MSSKLQRRRNKEVPIAVPPWGVEPRTLPTNRTTGRPGQRVKSRRNLEFALAAKKRKRQTYHQDAYRQTHEEGAQPRTKNDVLNWSVTHGEVAVKTKRMTCSQPIRASADPLGALGISILHATPKRSVGESSHFLSGAAMRGQIDGTWCNAHLTCTNPSSTASPAPRHRTD